MRRIYIPFKRLGQYALDTAGLRVGRQRHRETKERIVAATKTKGLSESKREKLEKKRSKLEKKLREVEALLNPPPAQVDDQSPAPEVKAKKAKKSKKAAKPAKAKAKAKAKKR